MSHRLNVTLNLALSICYNANCNAQTEQGSRAGLAERLHTHTENETHQSLFPKLILFIYIKQIYVVEMSG